MLSDLHTHTTASDGIKNVKDLMLIALDRGITHLAITDHDSIDSLEEFRNCVVYSEKYLGISNYDRIIGIPGIEFGCPYGDYGEVHILGYGIDFKNQQLNDTLNLLKKGREERFYKMIDRLNKLGVEITEEELLKYSPLPGRSHFARILVDKNYVATVQEAFSKYIGNGKPGFVRRVFYSVSDTVDLIKASGGIPVLAHPVISGLSKDDILKIVDWGIQGIEVFYPEHSIKHRKKLLKIAEENSLIVTGGTDFHGVRHGVVQELGMPDYPENYLNDFMDHLADKNLFVGEVKD